MTTKLDLLIEKFRQENVVRSQTKQIEARVMEDLQNAQVAAEFENSGDPCFKGAYQFFMMRAMYNFAVHKSGKESALHYIETYAKPEWITYLVSHTTPFNFSSSLAEQNKQNPQQQ